jgi:hypothetical protein
MDAAILLWIHSIAIIKMLSWWKSSYEESQATQAGFILGLRCLNLIITDPSSFEQFIIPLYKIFLQKVDAYEHQTTPTDESVSQIAIPKKMSIETCWSSIWDS